MILLPDTKSLYIQRTWIEGNWPIKVIKHQDLTSFNHPLRCGDDMQILGLGIGVEIACLIGRFQSRIPNRFNIHLQSNFVDATLVSGWSIILIWGWTADSIMHHQLPTTVKFVWM